MTNIDMFEDADLSDKIKALKKELKESKKTSCDLEAVIESQKKEIDTLKQIIDTQELQLMKAAK